MFTSFDKRIKQTHHKNWGGTLVAISSLATHIKKAYLPSRLHHLRRKLRHIIQMTNVSPAVFDGYHNDSPQIPYLFAVFLVIKKQCKHILF